MHGAPRASRRDLTCRRRYGRRSATDRRACPGLAARHSAGGSLKPALRTIYGDAEARRPTTRLTPFLPDPSMPLLQRPT
eukprot:12019377-Alexandrium_andersonii.AAC.1